MKRWVVKSEINDKDKILSTLLKNRGIFDKEKFLDPPPLYSYLRSFPLEFKDSLKIAAHKINEYIKKDLPIVIHGDYDADGICSTAILYKTIYKNLKHKKCYAFIPDRFIHSYGLSKSSVSDIKKLVGGERALLITVDCGITATEEVKLAEEKGFEVIITDHHQRPEKLPKAFCIVWNDSVVASTIALLLSQTLGIKENDFVAFAALATVTDLQPLVGFNRPLVKEGLEILNSSTHIGLRKLLEVSGKTKDAISTYDLGWIIGPRLNSTGRLVNASESLQLLIEEDEAKLRQIANKLNEVNKERQDKTLKMYELSDIKEIKNIPAIIVKVSENFHEGVIGLIAAKLTQKYYRPSIVISMSDGIGKGSVRSISGIDIISILRKFEDLFESLGGHPMAAGFAIKKANIAKLKISLEKYCEKNIDKTLLIPFIDIDAEVPLNILDVEVLEELQKMEPFGIGNLEPVFMSKNVGITSVNTVGKDANHLSFKFLFNGNYYKGILFSRKKEFSNIKIGDSVDIVFNLKSNVYNGKKYMDLMIREMRTASLLTVSHML